MCLDGRPGVSAQVGDPRGIHGGERLDVVALLSGVSAAAAATGVPFMGSDTTQRMRADGTTAPELAADRVATTPGLFATLGVPLLAGRDFRPTDSVAGRVAIVNESLAKALFPQGNAVGARIRLAD